MYKKAITALRGDNISCCVYSFFSSPQVAKNSVNAALDFLVLNQKLLLAKLKSTIQHCLLDITQGLNYTYIFGHKTYV